MSGEKKTAEKPPAGMEPMMMSMKMMDAYGVKTGPGLKDTVPFKIFEKDFVMKEIVDLGFYSAFHPVRAQLQVRRGPARLLYLMLLPFTAALWPACVRLTLAEVPTESNPCDCGL